MSVEKKKDNDVDQCRPKSVEEAVGSHYALQVALQTMKERCQHLQQRLGAVEEENLCLRIENRKRRPETTTEDAAAGDTKSEIDRLEEKVAQLSRQKTQLTHHLFMVATENRQLWNRLSHLTEANQNLGSHLSKISSTLSRHNSASSITTKEPEPSSGTKAATSDTTEESLEEISLKLIKSFLQEKTELEEQYAQMVEIQSDPSYGVVQNLSFGLPEDGDETVEDMKRHHETLLELRRLVQEQQCVLKSAVMQLERAKQGGVICTSCREKTKQTLTDAEIEEEMESLRKWGIPDGTYSEEVRRQLDQVAEPPPLVDGSCKFEERMCPICGTLYDKTTPFSSFQKHVVEHFVDEEESYSIINNFEVVT